MVERNYENAPNSLRRKTVQSMHWVDHPPHLRYPALSVSEPEGDTAYRLMVTLDDQIHRAGIPVQIRTRKTFAQRFNRIDLSPGIIQKEPCHLRLRVDLDKPVDIGWAMKTQFKTLSRQRKQVRHRASLSNLPGWLPSKSSVPDSTIRCIPRIPRRE